MIAGLPRLAIALAALVTPGPQRRAGLDSTPAVVRDVTARRDSLPPDRWLGSDKVQHALLSGATLAFGFAGLRAAGVDRRPALTAAAVPTAAIAIGKEVRDRRVGGRFSVRDLVADALGAVAYAAVLARTAR